jgi:protoheme ferro-lyase
MSYAVEFTQGAEDDLLRLYDYLLDRAKTLEELDVENREIFMEHGGEQFAYVPCLNDSPEGMQVIQAIAERELKGWI